MESLNAHIDALLDEHRPERYDVGDKTWRAAIYAEVERLVPDREARRIAASQLVDQREGVATRGANDLLRQIGRMRQWPLDWMEQGVRPLSVGSERVRLADGTVDDLARWAIEERRVAAQDFAARSFACDGAEWCAEQMRINGWLTFGDGCTGAVA